MKGEVLSGGREEKERQLAELVGDQRPSPEARLRSKTEQERREQRRCRERSDCQRSDGEELASHCHLEEGGQRT